MMRTHGASLLALFATVLCAEAGAATPMRFERFGSDEGLSQQAVLAIGQDARGFMWLGTEDGLNRFDGFSFHHANESDGLANAFVTDIERDATGALWVATDGSGVLSRDLRTGQFSASWANGSSDTVELNSARTVKIDGLGRVWIGTREAGVVVYDARSLTFKRFRHSADNAATLSADAIHSLQLVASGAWVGTENGLDYIDGTLDKPVARYTLAKSAKYPPEAHAVRALIEDRAGTLWIGTGYGLIQLEPRTGEQILFQADPRNPSALPSNEVQTLLEDSARRLWVGTTAGLALYDPHKLGFDTYKHDAADSSSLPDDRVVSLFEDRGGLLWVGTQLAGVAKWNPRSWSFGHRLERDVEPTVNNVTSFTQDRTGTLWIGTFGAGLRTVDEASSTTRRWRRGMGRLDDDAIMALLTDRAGALWIGTMSAGLIRLSPDRKTTEVFCHDPSNAHSLPADGVMSLLEDSAGRIWVGTYGGGLARFAPASRDFRPGAPGAQPTNPLSIGRVTSLAEDHEGRIWAGTDGAGLHVLTPTTGAARQWQHNSNDASSLAANTIYALHVDASSTLWIGTHGRGLDSVSTSSRDLSQLKFAHFREAQGLPDNTVYAILSDDDNNLWFSTGHGLAAMSGHDHVVRAFHRSQGLQGEEFNFGAAFRSDAGQLYFGGTNGYNVFTPTRLQFNKHLPPVALTGISILNQPLRAALAYEELGQVQLGYRDQVVTFDFAALDFAAPRENRYRYRLDGFDDRWVDAGTRRSATYTRLSGGRYTFRVQASNADGRWSSADLALNLDVEAPPWRRGWAYASYVAVLALLLYAGWNAWREKREREKRYRIELETEVRDRTREIAERNAELEDANRRLQEASLTDPLTGLANRRALMQSLPGLAASCHVERRVPPAPPQIVLMIVDLDCFKPINDRHGHEAGDDVLKQVAVILRDCVRMSDLTVRWGGDEFVVVYTSADLDDGAALAERIRSRIAKHHFRLSSGATARTSCSIGFVCYPFVRGAPHLLSYEQALNVADTALLESKAQRNAWIGWGGTPATHEITDLFTTLDTNASSVAAKSGLRVLSSKYRPDDTVEELIRTARSR